MELGPVERVRAMGPVGTRRAADVTPAIAVEGAGRTANDSYGSDAKRQERGLEDEDGLVESNAEGEADEARLNLFA